MQQSVVHLRPEDNVAIACRMLQPGEEVRVNGYAVKSQTRLLMGHKLALTPIAEGSAILKFGQIIGFASKAISPGDHVHTHNVACDAFTRDYAASSAIPEPPVADRPYTFNGYLRDDGRVGTRNYIALVSTVNCSATTCKMIVDRVRNELLKDYPHVDGVIALTHKSGCGMSASGLDREHLERTLAGFARHPNVFDYIVVGLGCEVNESNEFVDSQQLVARSTGKRPRILTIQGLGGIQKTVEAGVRAVAELLPLANAARRTTQPAGKIVLGTNCGGSDGNSGVTANPALGVASDKIVAQGGCSIIGETTEMYGAEHLLTRRAVKPSVAEKLIERIKWWEWYAAVFGAEINNNPSQGNKQGGLTTIYEKSLGAIAKGGNSALVDVYRYAEKVTTPGFVIMDTPGFDPPSVTGIVAGGANVMVFTTGRGSVFGCKPTPTIKVATNSPLYHHMIDDMDVNAGTILEGTPVEKVGQEIFEKILAVASGEKTKSEAQGVGDEEFHPWTIGPIL